MPFVTHFKDTDGQELPIAASTLITVEIPAAGSTAKGDWLQAADSTTEHYNQQAAVNAPKSSAVIPHCTDPSVFTDHGLTINYEEQLQGWVLWIDSLPETACTLTLLFINHSTEGTPCVLPALGVGGGTKVIDLDDPRYGNGYGDVIFGYSMQAGKHEHAIEDAGEIELFKNIFVDCGPDEPVLFRTRTSDGSMMVETSSYNKAYASGDLAQISITLSTFYMGDYYNTTVSLLNEGTRCSIKILCLLV